MTSKTIRKKKIGKNLAKAREALQKSAYSLTEGINSLKAVKYAKFDETLEVVMKLGVDPKHSNQMVRGMVSLPKGSGKNIRVAAVCKETAWESAKSAGADIVGSDEIIASIKSGEVNFDTLIATPDMMANLAQVARILGPRGLMPNPKLGTVTTDIETAVKNAKAGQVEFRVEKEGIIHAGVGKMSFSSEDLLVNVKALVEAVMKAKPQAAKGTYMQNVYLSSTMGPSVKIELDSIA